MAPFRGIISAIRAMPDPRDNVYTAMGDKSAHFKSGTLLALNDVVEFDADAIGRDSQQPFIEKVSVVCTASPEDLKSRIDAISDMIMKASDSAALDRLLSGHAEMLSCAAGMRDGLLQCARAFAGALASGAPIIVRFHNDGDGSTGAIALYRAVNLLQSGISLNPRGVIWKMQRGIAYDDESMYDDILHFNQYASAVRPIVTIIDFGTSPESEPAIYGSEGRYDFIWLDHHPPYKGFPASMIKFYLNPWDFNGNSDFTAGALACSFATVLHECGARELLEASLVSDYSAYADYGDRNAQDMALVLDFLTSGSRAHGLMGMTPKTFSEILGNQKRYSEALFSARNMLDEALEIGMKSAKRYRNGHGFNIYALDFGHIAEMGKGYPLPGRFSSRLQWAFEKSNGGRTITIVHYGNYISLRESGDIVAKVKILDVVNELKAACQYVESGGGHNEAASMRVPKEHTEYVMKLLLKHLGVDA
jgi:RecJ-like exonuclease